MSTQEKWNLLSIRVSLQDIWLNTRKYIKKKLYHKNIKNIVNSALNLILFITSTLVGSFFFKAKDLIWY